MIAADVIDTSPETRAAVLAAYHARATEYDRACVVAAEHPSPETCAARDRARVALYAAERAALRAA